MTDRTFNNVSEALEYFQGEYAAGRFKPREDDPFMEFLNSCRVDKPDTSPVMEYVGGTAKSDMASSYRYDPNCLDCLFVKGVRYSCITCADAYHKAMADPDLPSGYNVLMPAPKTEADKPIYIHCPGCGGESGLKGSIHGGTTASDLLCAECDGMYSTYKPSETSSHGQQILNHIASAKPDRLAELRAAYSRDFVPRPSKHTVATMIRKYEGAKKVIHELLDMVEAKDSKIASLECSGKEDLTEAERDWIQKLRAEITVLEAKLKCADRDARSYRDAIKAHVDEKAELQLRLAAKEPRCSTPSRCAELLGENKAFREMLVAFRGTLTCIKDKDDQQV